MTLPDSLAVILLAGGNGSRMQMDVPKQFMCIGGRPLVDYSLKVLCQASNLVEIVVVCSPEYRHHVDVSDHPITFALPGSRRQDSVYNGLKALKTQPEFVCIHDAARPFITLPLVDRVRVAATLHGAATAAMPVKFTVKESGDDGFVARTPDRARCWEIQTPQIIRYQLLCQGFDHAITHDLTVTDDVSLVELLGALVKLVEGCYHNIKITTQDDLAVAINSLNNTAPSC